MRNLLLVLLVLLFSCASMNNVVQEKPVEIPVFKETVHLCFDMFKEVGRELGEMSASGLEEPLEVPFAFRCISDDKGSEYYGTVVQWNGMVSYTDGCYTISGTLMGEDSEVYPVLETICR